MHLGVVIEIFKAQCLYFKEELYVLNTNNYFRLILFYKPFINCKTLWSDPNPNKSK